MLAPWIGGASSVPAVTGGQRSLLAFWMGGACALRSAPPTPPGPVLVDDDEGPRKKWDRHMEQQWLQRRKRDEKEVMELLTLITIALCQDD